MAAPAVARAPSTGPSQRQRAQTLLSASTSANISPSLSRSYHQPLGTGSLRRTQQQGSHVRSRSHGDAGASLSAVAKGKRRAVFCDVVVDDLELDENGVCVYPTGPASDFLNSLGSPITLPESSSSQPQPIRPMTPGKVPKVDFDKVRQSLHELWVTEESYLRKVSSLLKDYAIPLRTFSKRRDTAVIPPFEATHLFINLEQLVPIAEAFEADLRQLVSQMQKDKSSLPSDYGEVILQHVERMEPYKKWLANVSASEAIRRELDKHNSSFREFVERTQVHSRETAQATGGFKEFLAEPFQRVSRYRLMLDPIIFHLPPDDPNVEPLQIAIGILTDICSMQVDDATKRAATFWSLKETIDGFPDALVGFDREFIDCIDADEIIEIADSRPTTLRCTLFLFNDKVLIAKRPSGDKTGKVHAGVDDIDRTVSLYQTSHLSSTQASLLGSPKKLRKGVLGFRGLVDLAEVVAVDFGTSAAAPQFGLVFDHPPVDQSERWCGRPARKFVVANTYAPDVKRAEKEAWFGRFAEAVMRAKLKDGAKAAKRGKAMLAGGSSGETSEVYWALWDRRSYERLRGTQKGKLALHVVDEGSPSLDYGKDARPVVLARATLLPSQRCRFEVRSNDSASNSEDTISIDRIAPAIAELGMSYGLFSFPTLRPLPIGSARSRPRSGLLSVFDVFSSGGGLKRGNSLVSKGSSAATTTLDTPNLSASNSPRASSPVSPQPNSLSQSYRRPVSAKMSAPDLYASMSGRGSAARTAEAYDGVAEMDVVPSTSATSLRNNGRGRPRRSLSLPPPLAQPSFHSPTTTQDLSYGAPSPADTTTPEAPDDADATMDASVDTPWSGMRELEAPTTSPIAYRPPVVGSTRRRMIGPRDMRTPSMLQESVGGPGPSHLPFAREHSPTPQRRPHTSNSSIATFQSSPSYADLVDDSLESQTSSVGAATKRPRPPVEASPRPTPAKKVASFADLGMGPRAHGGEGVRNLSGPRRPSNSTLERRIPSSSSAQIKIRSRRVTSGTSTICAPATPPKDVVQPDVFSSPAAIVAEKQWQAVEDVQMEEAHPDPFERLRKHVDDMRLKISRELTTANKENERIVSPTALTRSPQTRNVFGKSFGSKNSFASSQHRLSNASLTDTRPRHKIDVQILSDWTRKLADLVAAAQAQAAAVEAAASKPRTPSPAPVNDAGGSALEMEMLEQERDLLAAELAALKEEAKTLVNDAFEKQSALEAAQGENAKLRQAYSDICQEADTLYAEFNAALESVTLAAQAEPSASGEYVDLVQQLEQSVSARYKTEHDLRVYRRKVEAELEEKARWGELLRRHGLLA
ncbi:hypothetical protein JCM10049v2_001314 [Rhodotorula toruloides]